MLPGHGRLKLTSELHITKISNMVCANSYTTRSDGVRHLPIGRMVDLTHHNKDRSILIQGPEITIRPVSMRLLTRDDAQ